MTKKDEPFEDKLHDYLNEARAEGSGGLLDAIPAHNVGGKPRNQETRDKPPVRLAKAPKPSDIDYGQTSDNMLLDGEAILKDGRHVTF